PVEHRSHGLAIRGELERTLEETNAERSALVDIEELRAIGSIIVLEGADASYPLQLDRLTRLNQARKVPRRPQWLLLSVQPGDGDRPEHAVVWVADEYRSRFLKIFEEYLTEVSTLGDEANWDTPEGNPRYRALVANIAHIRRALLRDLWTSEGEPPEYGVRWWELWLDTGQAHAESIDGFISTYQLRSLPRTMTLRDRHVVWVEATWAQLQILPFTKVPIAEVRRPGFIDTIEDLAPNEQDEYVTDLAARLIPAPEDAPAVCHLDTGVFRPHLLIEGSLATIDQHTVVGGSGNDSHGHGTSMAGLALFGDELDAHLVSARVVALEHRLESVKLIPDADEPQHDPRDYGTATIEAVALPEIVNRRRRVYCLPVSTEPDRPGEPTLWSASLDALAVGTDAVRDGDDLRLLTAPDPDSARLILVAAGNVTSYQADHHTESDTTPVADPGQAWNAITVGAFTNLTEVPADPSYRGWSAQAGEGELSPHSRTSLMFNQRRWPIKPDICMEGGNVITDGGDGFEDKHPLLSLRSTGIANNLAVTSANATSAATAQAARLAARTMARYPAYWSETVRGLLTHSAEWTPAMRAELDCAPGKAGRLQLLRRYGWGVPDEQGLLTSANSAVTLVVQDRFVPFEGDDLRMRQFRLHELPWPVEVLEELGAAEVRMRITLSYFVEPSASRRGWRQRYSYASHGLRFDLQSPLETSAEFVHRVNRDAQSTEDGTTSSASGASQRWFIGDQQRHYGSLHQDEWHGTGAELAASSRIAVYPVGGWWKNNSRKDRSDLPIRYSIIVSLRTAAAAVDLYTPIAIELGVPVAGSVGSPVPIAVEIET
ncbi:MAG: S8 family peptidase, partial [Propionibacteriaceae bacterium]|nr:S8 family peptidase [Propionibacteriaceae bacterium]